MALLAGASPRLGLAAQAANSGSKRLIEFGWDEPGTAFLRAHIAAMERMPFDGCVLHADAVAADGKAVDFTWKAWGRRVFSAAALAPAIRDLQATKFHRFTDNFLRFNVTPGDVDWFDDFSAILHNARLAAAVAHAGHCKGVYFDIEEYGFPLFDYPKQREAGSKSWPRYAAQARRRGGEVMRAFQAGFPGLVIFLSHGYCLPWLESREGKQPLAKSRYGLLAPFLDGMVEKARGKTRLVDGYEPAYGFKDTARFARAYRQVRHGLLPIVRTRDRAQYERRFSVGFGIWMDDDWRRLGWHTRDLARNYYTPAAFAASVSRALQVADRYVWVYTETPRWWTPAGDPAKVPAAYIAALRRARRETAGP